MLQYYGNTVNTLVISGVLRDLVFLLLLIKLWQLH